MSNKMIESEARTVDSLDLNEWSVQWNAGSTCTRYH